MLLLLLGLLRVGRSGGTQQQPAQGEATTATRVASASCVPAPELIRRFLQHVLPSGFLRIRYFGLFANRNRAETSRRFDSATR